LPRKPFNHIFKRKRQNILSACRRQIALEFLLILALPAARRLALDPYELAVDDANDVRRSLRAKPIEVSVLPLERTAIVSIMENPAQLKVVEYLAL